MRKNNIRLFINGFLYVFLLSGNTYCIAKLWWIGIAVFGFLISFLWTVNVKRVAASSITSRVAYAGGAMFGGLAGVALMHLVKSFITT